MNSVRPEERGATLILVALTITMLVGIAALAVDLGVLRSDIRSDRLVADAASTAGVAQINPFGSTNAVAACQTAWDYVLLNLEDEGSSVVAPNCSGTFGGECSPATLRQASGTAGPYTITITQPVPDGNTLMGAQAINAEIDGSACQRLGVTVQRLRSHAFAKVIGIQSNTTTVSSVARVATSPGEGEIVPLLLLEPLGCEAIYTSGQGKVTVSYNDTTDTPGIIVVDSNASTCGASHPFSIDSRGNQKGWIRAIPVPGEEIPSAILSYALSAIPPANPAASYDPGDLTDPVNPADITDPTEPSVSHFRLFPKPTPSFERITRAPIDWRYNCKSGYPDYPLVATNPAAGGVRILDCPFGTGAHIDAHRSAYAMGMPIGFQSWMGAGHPCSTTGAAIVVTGNWYIDCPATGPDNVGLVVNGGSISIAGNVVSNGGIDLRSDAVMTINPGNASDHFVFIRSGIMLKRAQASLTLNRTFVYLENGRVDLRAGDGGLVWTSPDAGNFEDLALWSESHMVHEIGGQAGNTLTGTFFTPMAEPFSLTGQAGQFQFEAQFITRRLEVKGQGEVKMTPDPDKTTPIPARAVALIR